MYCQNCGAQDNNPGKFCAKCGAPFNNVQGGNANGSFAVKSSVDLLHQQEMLSKEDFLALSTE